MTVARPRTAPRRPPLSGRPTGFLGLYSLSLLQKGPLCGAQIARRIWERTNGSWRVSPGAMYPVLQGLRAQGFCRRTRSGQRWMYELTPRGRQRLWLSRRRSEKWRERFQNVGPLLLDMQRPAARARFVRDRAEQIVSWAVETLDRTEHWPDPRVRREIRRELARFLQLRAEELAADNNARRPSRSASIGRRPISPN
jgi:DNA-binding PadR family transcriptional regulator